MKGQEKTMERDFSQDKLKLVLTYPHKSKFNTIGLLFMAILYFIVLWALKHLISYNTELSDRIIIAIVLFVAPLTVWFIGYYLFVNGVKLEIYENNFAQYYTYGSRGHSRLLFGFKLEDIEQTKIKDRPFNCQKLSIKIKNPIFYGMHEKKINKIRNVSIVADRESSRWNTNIKAKTFYKHIQKIFNSFHLVRICSSYSLSTRLFAFCLAHLT